LLVFVLGLYSTYDWKHAAFGLLNLANFIFIEAVQNALRVIKGMHRPDLGSWKGNLGEREYK
jgi:hypothetical protein